jgi:hypothetical protein
MGNATEEALYQHLGFFDRPEFPDAPRWFKRRGHHILDNIMQFQPGAFGRLADALSSEAIESLSLRWSKGSGPRYKKKGFKSKGEAWKNGAKEELVRDVSALLGGSFRAPHPACAGGRGKLSTKAKIRLAQQLGRLVWEMDVVDVGIGTLVLQPINAWHRGNPNITSVGKTFFYNGGQHHSRYFGYDRDERLFGVGTDARKLDSSLRGWLVREIFKRFRRGFVDGHDATYDVLFEFLCQLHIGGDIYMPGGAFWRVGTGSCSGAPFVSMMECYYTGFIHQYGLVEMLQSHKGWYFRKCARYIARHLRILCLGDDNWFTVNGPIPLEHFWCLRRFRALTLFRFGVEIHITKSHQGHGLGAFFYLSRKLDEECNTYRDLSVTLERWKYPENKMLNPSKSYVRAAALMADNPTITVAVLMCDYMAFLRRKYKVVPGLCDWVDDFVFREADVNVTDATQYGDILLLYRTERPADQLQYDFRPHRRWRHSEPP